MQMVVGMETRGGMEDDLLNKHGQKVVMEHFDV